MADFSSGGMDDKLACFQAITGIDDLDLCAEILEAHGWNLELAVPAITGGDASAGIQSPPGDPPGIGPSGQALGDFQSRETESQFLDQAQLPIPNPNPNPNPRNGNLVPGLAWKLVKLPFYVISGSLGLITGAVGFGFSIAGGVLSYSMDALGLGTGGGSENSRLLSVSAGAAEAMRFIEEFDRVFGGRTRPIFVREGFMDALQRSRNEFKMLFVYLHSPEHPDTEEFCERTLCTDIVAGFVNENFVSWGGNIRSPEGFKMSNSLKASRFPFCAVVMAATNQRVALLQQIEGPRNPEQLITILQRVVDESAPGLVSARLDEEERRTNRRLREEQDAAYRAALEADQARERQRIEEQERLEREAAEAERKRKEEEDARDREAREAAEREAALERRRQEKALSLGVEPEKAPDVTQVLVRFPTGERKERRFNSTATIETLYDYVDSLGVLKAEKYQLVSNFPRVVYNAEKYHMSLKEAGLHPQASLFVEVDS